MNFKTYDDPKDLNKHEEVILRTHAESGYSPCNITVTTSTAGAYCEHLNGFFAQIPYLIYFFKSIFVCLDCKEILYGKELKRHKKKLKES